MAHIIKAKNKSKREIELQDALTDKQLMFCQAYLACLNGAEAARVAGYKAPGVTAAQMLDNPKIQRYLKHHQRKMFDELELTAEEVHREIAHIIRQRATDVYDEGGRIISNPHDMEERANATVCEIEEESWTDSDGEIHKKIKLKRVNKMEALKLAADVLGLKAPQKMAVVSGSVLDWAQLYGEPEGAREPDPIEEVE